MASRALTVTLLTVLFSLTLLLTLTAPLLATLLTPSLACEVGLEAPLDVAPSGFDPQAALCDVQIGLPRGDVADSGVSQVAPCDVHLGSPRADVQGTDGRDTLAGKDSAGAAVLRALGRLAREANCTVAKSWRAPDATSSGDRRDLFPLPSASLSDLPADFLCGTRPPARRREPVRRSVKQPRARWNCRCICCSQRPRTVRDSGSCVGLRLGESGGYVSPARRLGSRSLGVIGPVEFRTDFSFASTEVSRRPRRPSCRGRFVRGR